MDISFTARLSNIMALTTVITEAGAGLDSAAIQAKAKELEGEIYKRTISKKEYEDACAKELDSWKQQVDDEQQLDEAETFGLNPNGPDFGPYKKATFYKDGLFSTIFKAAAEEEVETDVRKGPGARSTLVALKVTTPSAMTPPHDSEREARILQEAKSKFVIPLISNFWQPGGRLVLVFPFMPVDLETLMRTSSLDPIDIRGIARDLFTALFHVHGQGIIHRDVKPSNILLRSKRGAAYLADFGIAWSPNDPTSEPAQNKITDVGTTSYRPPELLFGHAAYDTSLDLWAAGCTVAEMVHPNHKSVFDAGDMGSELALIRSIFETLGTPNEKLWPSVKNFQDWGKMRFVEYPAKDWGTILDGTSKLAVDFVSRLIQYEGSWRMTASQGIDHAFLAENS